MSFQTETQADEVKPWKKELIVLLFKRKKILRVLLILFVLPAIILVFRFFYVGVRLHHQNNQVLEWLETPCQVIDTIPYHSAKENHYDFWDPGNPAVTEGDGPSRYYTRHHEILYEYIFDETTYISKRYSIPRYYEMIVFDMYSGEDFSLDSNYVSGGFDVCYVNPNNPEQAVLSRSSLSVSDYGLHMFWPLVVFVIYFFIPGFVFKKYNDDKKQLSELVTGQKENILEGVNRMLDPLGGEDSMLF